MPPKSSRSPPTASVTSTTNPSPECAALLTTTSTTLTLLSRFLSTLSSSPTTTTTTIDFSPLSLLAQSTTLIRAHTTKLSLLLLNKPFTPSAIRKVLEQMNKEALPGLAAGVQIVQGLQGVYGKTMVDEACARVGRVYRELKVLMEEVIVMIGVESQAGARADRQRGGARKVVEVEKKNRDTLASTGVLWAACDAVGELERLGVVGVVVKKVAFWREMLEDAVAEIREWVEGDGDEDSDDEDDDDEDDKEYDDENGNGAEEAAQDDDAETVDALMDKLNLNPSSIPKSNTALKAIALLALKRLKLTSTLYAAVSKRRLKTLVVPAIPPASAPSTSSQTIKKLDALMDKLKTIPEETDELASALYDLDEEEAKRVLDGIMGVAGECLGLVEKGWEEGKDVEDEFAVWAGRWRDAVAQS